MEDRVKMNEQFLNYSLIKNTIPGAKNQISNGSLTIGSVVTNLAVELNQDNVFNPYYPEYYGDTKTLKDGWGCKYETGTTRSETKTQVFTTNSSTTGGPTVEKVNATITEENVPTVEGPSNMYIYRITANVTKGKDWTCVPSDSNILVIVSDNGKDSGLWQGTYTSTDGQVNFTAELQSTTTSAYHTTTTVSISSFELELEEGESVTGVEVSGDVSSYSVNGDVITLNFISTNTSYSVTFKFYLSYEADYDEISNKGLLVHTVKLKQGKTYVLQVINAASPRATVLPNSKITTAGGMQLSFDQYIFFETRKSRTLTEDDYTLQIYGTSFGYQIFAKTDNGIIELRRFTSPLKSKVFLFESSTPWIVDNNGVIIGLKDTPLESFNDLSVNAQAAKVNSSQIKEIFSQKPQLEVVSTDTKQTLRILLPETTSESAAWKYYDIIKTVYDNNTDINPLRLIVYRDFLTETNRDYNNSVIKTRRSKIKTLQKDENCTPAKDTYSINELSSYSIGVTQPTLTWTNNVAAIEMDFCNNTTLTIDKYNKEDPEFNTISLPLLPLFGYNRQYCVEQNLLLESKGNLPYKYTSFAFAWGMGERGEPERISDFSEPIIVDRRATTITENDGVYTLTLNDCVLSRETDSNYYNQEAIYLKTK